MLNVVTTSRQRRLLRALDSSDFHNVVECLLDQGPTSFPGLTFEWDGNDVLIHAYQRPENVILFGEIAKSLNEWLGNPHIGRVGNLPRYKIVEHPIPQTQGD